MGPTKTASRPQLAAATVVDRALAIADAEGLQRVTIRRLADEFDVTPMALYWHFTNKDELLAAMGDRLIDGVQVSDDSGAPWPQRVRAVMVALVDVLREHPNVADLATTRILDSEGGLKLTEDVLTLLGDAGFSTRVQADIACLALQTAIMLVNGQPGAEQGVDPEDRDAHREAKRARLATLPKESFPHLLAAADDLLGCNDTEGYYRRGIDLFIAGIQGLKD